MAQEQVLRFETEDQLAQPIDEQAQQVLRLDLNSDGLSWFDGLGVFDHERENATSSRDKKLFQAFGLDPEAYVCGVFKDFKSPHNVMLSRSAPKCKTFGHWEG